MIKFNLPEIPKLYETTKRWKWRQLAAFVVLALVLVLSVVIPEKTTKPKEIPPEPFEAFSFPKKIHKPKQQKYDEYDFSNFN